MSLEGERLESAVVATQYQREWFARTAERARAGEPLALVNADAPHEILRAMGIPYVVNQWWSSIIAAKRAAPASLSVVAKLGLPDDSRQYDVLPLGAQDLPNDERPWGGLPDPRFVIAERSGDVTHKIFERWGRRENTETFLLSRTGADPAPAGWWDLVPHDWEDVFGHDRISFLQAEMESLIVWIEERVEHRFDMDELATIMRLGNEQAEWNRRTRDLIATARPLPVSVTDTIPGVMVPQWHRGTQWAVDAARRLHDEVAERVDARAAVAPTERRRLMWIGRGLWNDLDMYRSFQEDFGAVFVWSMYLALGADGYRRYGPDPLRCLAARFVGITDLLYVPPMSSSWYAKEALSHGVDGAVHLVADDTPGAALITEALEEVGVPTLEIRASNADPRATAEVRERVASFLRHRVPETRG